MAAGSVLCHNRHRENEQSCERDLNELHRFLLMTVWGVEPPFTGFIRWSSTKPWLLTGILAHTGTARHVNSLCRTLSKRGKLVQ
jgi:hypothetical protein